MKNDLISLAVAAVFSSVAGTAYAQQSVAPATGGIALGSALLYPSVDLTYKSNDNLFSQPDGPYKKRSDISVITPAARIEAKSGAHTFSLDARLEDGTYYSSKADNYTDFQMGADAALAFSGATGATDLKLHADFIQGHDERGAIYGAAIGSRPSVYQKTGVSGIWGYGTSAASARLELDGGYLNKRYDNNQTITEHSGTRFEQHDDSRYGATFYWPLMPKARLLIHAGQTRYDYNDSVFNSAGLTVRDSVETRTMAGVAWEALAATSGTIKIGFVDKDFKNLAAQDYSGSSWDAKVGWMPLAYSTLDFFTSRKPTEACYGSSTVDTTAGVAWKHAWNDKLSSDLTVGRLRQDYKGLGFARLDSTDFVMAKLSYQLQASLKVGLGYTNMNRNSSAAYSDYNRNVFSISLTGAL
jgi:hypothetical protein